MSRSEGPVTLTDTQNVVCVMDEADNDCRAYESCRTLTQPAKAAQETMRRRGPVEFTMIDTFPKNAPLPSRIEPAALHRAVKEPYWNNCLTSVNDHEVRMSVMTQAFGWHLHPDTDESFLVLEGELVITFEKGEVVLAPGQMLTVQRGTLHKTRPNGDRSVNLTFERANASTIFSEHL